MFQIRFTPTQRTTESARYFGIGLFNKDISKNIDYPGPTEKSDPVLRVNEKKTIKFLYIFEKKKKQKTNFSSTKTAVCL